MRSVSSHNRDINHLLGYITIFIMGTVAFFLIRLLVSMVCQCLTPRFFLGF